MIGLISRISLIVILLYVTQCTWVATPSLDTLIVGLSDSPVTLDPRFSTDANGQRVCDLIFSALVQLTPDLKISGDLAESWSYADKTYSFEIRPQVFFHNGSPLSKADLILSLQQFSKTSSPFFGQFEKIKKFAVEYDIHKGGRVQITLSEFSASFLYDLTLLKILPQKQIDHLQKRFYTQPIGTGPYQFVSDQNNQLQLRAFDNYYRSPPKTKNLVFKSIRDASTRFHKVYKGEIDLVQSDIPHSKVKFFQKSPDFKVQIKPSLSTTYLLINMKHPDLKLLEFRQALAASLDIKPILQFKFEGLADKALSLLPKAHPDHYPALEHKKLTLGKIQTIFSKQRQKPLLFKTSNNFDAIENGRILVQQLQEKGLQIHQRTFEWGTLYEDIKKGNFELALMKWVGITDPDLYRISLHSNMVPPGRNRGSYSNPLFDKTSEEASREDNPLTRHKLVKQMQEIVHRDLPIIPLWYDQQVAIINKRVKGYELSLTGDFSGLLNVYKEDKP